MREAGKFWDSPDQAAHVETIVRRHPRRQTEGFITYIERVAVMAGLMRREQCGLLNPMDDIWAGGAEPTPHWTEREPVTSLAWPVYSDERGADEDTLAEAVGHSSEIEGR